MIEEMMKRAIEMSRKGLHNGGGPFGALIVCDGEVISESHNTVTIGNDPTAHAEIRLVSSYCQKNGLFDLTGATLYTCAEPCVMCSGAIKWASISRVVFSVSQAMLQNVSGGRLKPTCYETVNTGGRHIDVDGLLLVDEGLACYKGFDFALHRQEILKSQR